MDTGRRTLWISWYPHRRTSGLCEAWNVPLKVIGSRRAGARKWLEQAWGTLRLLRKERPMVLFVQNPSLGLTLLAALVRGWFGYLLVVDAHNEGVRPFIRSSAFAHWLTRRLLRAADITIVTNASLADDVRSAGGRPLVLPDRLPTPPAGAPTADARHDAAPDVLVISTFAPDEPIEAVMTAAAALPGLQFAMTGKPGRFASRGRPAPANMRLTGFVPEAEYWRLLGAARLVCDLTLMPDCLVCGAYEGLAMARPMILSDNPPTRALFAGAAVFTSPEPEHIAAAIREALARHAELEQGAARTRDQFRARWLAQATEVLDKIKAQVSGCTTDAGPAGT